MLRWGGCGEGREAAWAQVRCMAAVLLMVGRGQEEPSIVSRLLDVDATPSKPYYNMAAEVRDLPCMPASPAPARSILARYCGH